LLNIHRTLHNCMRVIKYCLPYVFFFNLSHRSVVFHYDLHQLNSNAYYNINDVLCYIYFKQTDRDVETNLKKSFFYWSTLRPAPMDRLESWVCLEWYNYNITGDWPSVAVKYLCIIRLTTDDDGGHINYIKIYTWIYRYTSI